MSKFSQFDDFASNKQPSTERKPSKPTFDHTFQRDYALEKQYLEKLKAQRIKAEQLLQKYNTIYKNLQKERQNTIILRQQIEEMREKNKAQATSLKNELQKQRIEIRQLLSEKSIFMKKLKEQESQQAYLHSLKKEQQQYKFKIQELSQTVSSLKRHTRQKQQQIQMLKDKHLAFQKEKMQLRKEIKRQKDEKTALEQEKNKFQQTIIQKSSTFEKLVANLEKELQIKDSTFQKMNSQLQESNKYLAKQYEDKCRQVQYMKKSLEDQKQASRKGKEQVETMRCRIQQKQRKYESLQKDLSNCYNTIRDKQQQYQKLQLTIQEKILIAGQKQSGRLKRLEQENAELRQQIEQYQAIISLKQRRELQHKDLLQDELQEIKKFERIFRSIE